MIPWPNGYRAALSLSFDDARLSQVEFGLPLFAKLGTRATFYVTISTLNQRHDAWKQALRDGHEIGNHTMTHPCSGNYAWSRGNALEDYTLEKLAADIETADVIIADTLGIKTTTFAYPCGQKFVGRGASLQSYVPLIAKRFKVGRGYNDTTTNDPSFFDPAQVLSIDMDTKSLKDLMPALQLSLQQGSWLTLVGHDIGPDRARQSTLTKTIEDLCHFAASNGIWLDTIDCVASHILKR